LLEIEDSDMDWVVRRMIIDIETSAAPSETETYVMVLKDCPNIEFDSEAD